MKTALTTLVALLFLAANSIAADSISLGLRAGASVGQTGHYTEFFGDLHLNRLVSIGGTFGYSSVDPYRRNSYRRDESMPIIALFKVYAPTPWSSRMQASDRR